MTEQWPQSVLPGISLEHYSLVSETKLEPGDIAVQLNGTQSQLVFCVKLFEPGAVAGSPIQLLTFWDGEMKASLRVRKEESADLIKLDKWEIRMLGEWREYTGHIPTPSLLLAAAGHQLGCQVRSPQGPSSSKQAFSLPDMNLVAGRANPEPRYLCDYWAICATGARGASSVLVEVAPEGITLPFAEIAAAG